MRLLSVCVAGVVAVALPAFAQSTSATQPGGSTTPKPASVTLQLDRESAEFLRRFDEPYKDRADQILATTPENVDGYLDRCHVQVLRSNFKDALEDCNRALDLDPNNPSGYFLRGRAENGLGQPFVAQLDMQIGANLFLARGEVSTYDAIRTLRYALMPPGSFEMGTQNGSRR